MQQDNAKKSVLLRLNSDTWNEITRMADDEFRSINGQIEFLLNEALKQKKNLKNQN
jgi:hypothetical protein